MVPTAVEQLLLERLNDARADPAAYGRSIGLDLNNVAPSQPLAFDTRLIEAARLHSQDMSARNYFSHTGSGGSNPGQRLTAAGYPWNGWGESIAAGFATPEEALKGLIIDAGVPDLGHRRHLLAIDASFKTHQQVGVGIVQNGGGSYRHYYTIDSGYTADRRPFLTGVVYRDNNANGRYDLGEGLGGVTINVPGVGSVTTWDTGGFSLQLSAGTYSVTASGGGLASPVTRTVTVGSTNVRLNFTPSTPSNTDWTGWSDLTRTARDVAAFQNADGTQQVFVIGADNALYTRRQNPDGSWGAWASLGSQAKKLAVARNASGQLDLFIIGMDDHTWMRSQTAPGTFGAWTDLGGLCKQIAVGTATNGRQQVYVIGFDNGLWTRRQNADGSFGAWTNLGGQVKALATTVNAAGQLDVYAIGFDDHLWFRRQNADGTFTAWADLAGLCKQLAVGTGSDGRQQVFVIGFDNAVWTRRQNADGSFGAWTSLGGQAREIAAVRNGAGLIDVLAIGLDGRAWTRRQSSAGTFDAAVNLGGSLSRIAGMTDAAGRVSIVGVGSDTTTRSRSQTSAGVWA